MKKVLTIINEMAGWGFTVLCIAALIFAASSYLNTKKTGEPATIAGYRPVYVLTGSMEPFMMTDGIVLTKEVHSIDELSVGDVVTYHIEDDDGNEKVITHRIQEINEDGTMITKGDNNKVTDAIPITMANVEAKVMMTCNWTAALIHLWATARGKAYILSAVCVVILIWFGLKMLLSPEK